MPTKPFCSLICVKHYVLLNLTIVEKFTDLKKRNNLLMTPLWDEMWQWPWCPQSFVILKKSSVILKLTKHNQRQQKSKPLIGSPSCFTISGISQFSQQLGHPVALSGFDAKAPEKIYFFQPWIFFTYFATIYLNGFFAPKHGLLLPTSEPSSFFDFGENIL